MEHKEGEAQIEPAQFHVSTAQHLYSVDTLSVFYQGKMCVRDLFVTVA